MSSLSIETQNCLQEYADKCEKLFNEIQRTYEELQNEREKLLYQLHRYNFGVVDSSGYNRACEFYSNACCKYNDFIHENASDPKIGWESRQWWSEDVPVKLPPTTICREKTVRSPFIAPKTICVTPMLMRR
jgi:hypothetical protein